MKNNMLINMYKENSEIQSDLNKNYDLLYKYNLLNPSKDKKRDKLIRKIFKKAGNNIKVRSPFFCDCGYNITVGDCFFANFNCVILDTAEVTIGNNVLLGPNVGIYAASHPIPMEFRAEGFLTAAPITIEDDVWIGGHSVVLGGVRIGKGSVIGAGSIVVSDIPAGVIAVGNPCKVLRQITPEDKLRYKIP